MPPFRTQLLSLAFATGSWWAASNGDRYTIVVRDAAGAELASLDETAICPVASLSSGACLPCPGTTLGDPA